MEKTGLAIRIGRPDAEDFGIMEHYVNSRLVVGLPGEHETRSGAAEGFWIVTTGITSRVSDAGQFHHGTRSTFHYTHSHASDSTRPVSACLDLSMVEGIQDA